MSDFLSILWLFYGGLNFPAFVQAAVTPLTRRNLLLNRSPRQLRNYNNLCSSKSQQDPQLCDNGYLKSQRKSLALLLKIDNLMGGGEGLGHLLSHLGLYGILGIHHKRSRIQIMIAIRNPIHGIRNPQRGLQKPRL